MVSNFLGETFSCVSVVSPISSVEDSVAGDDLFAGADEIFEMDIGGGEKVSYDKNGLIVVVKFDVAVCSVKPSRCSSVCFVAKNDLGLLFPKFPL